MASSQSYNGTTAEIKNKDLRHGNSLWVLAKQLALARLKRGKTNWVKAKRRLIPERKNKISFWFRAKDIVFTSRSKDGVHERKKVL